MFSFNCCPEHQQKVAGLFAKWKFNYVVETGTFYGFTTAFFAERAKQVFTIEITPYRWTMHGGGAKHLLEGLTNIESFTGNSTDLLPTILQKIPSDEKIFFYLDAHGYSYWPLLDELDIIAQHAGTRAVIVIDDIKVPDKPQYGFDTYNGVACSLELIDPHLKKVYPGGYYHEYFNGPVEFQLVLDETDLNPVEKEIYLYNLKGTTMGKTGRILIHAKDLV
jgi:hypothetical protein